MQEPSTYSALNRLKRITILTFCFIVTLTLIGALASYILNLTGNSSYLLPTSISILKTIVLTGVISITAITYTTIKTYKQENKSKISG